MKQDCTRVILPPKDRKLSSNYLNNKKSYLILDPKKFLQDFPLKRCLNRIRETKFQYSSLKLMPTKELFSILMRPNTHKMSLRLCNSSQLAFKKTIVSSTNLRRDTLVLSFPNKKPSKTPCSSTLTTILIKTFVAMVKRKGDRGHPCPRPLEPLKHPLIHSLEWKN